MMARILDLPLFLLLAGFAAASMMVPALHAAALDSFFEARAFFYAGTLGLLLVAFVAIARGTIPRRRSEMHNLLALFAAFALLPLLLAIPFHQALRTTTFLNAYVEMVSNMTTTGAPMFAPERLSPTLHLWRALVGWMGGFLMWVSAAAILAPLNLGGFEVTASAEPGQSGETGQLNFERVDPQRRIIRVTAQLFPIYLGLTLTLWVLLLILGDIGLVALSHAMSTMATSGISPVGGLQNANSGIAGEALIALFMLFALSRLTFSSDTLTTAREGIHRDPEFRLGIAIVVVVPLALFMRHWVGAFDVDGARSLTDSLLALWGGVFTVLSFLTTTGFESTDWSEARAWSGLTTPGLIFLGLSLVGGGVATTAGGVKLLRVWALYLNGLREMERLVHPSSVGQSGGNNRRIRRQGAFIAWIFFMLFALTLTFAMVVFAALGEDFETSTILSIAALSNTGPLLSIAAETPVPLNELTDAAKLFFAAIMVLGRLEMLAIIALLTTDVWRN